MAVIELTSIITRTVLNVLEPQRNERRNVARKFHVNLRRLKPEKNRARRYYTSKLVSIVAEEL